MSSEHESSQRHDPILDDAPAAPVDSFDAPTWGDDAADPFADSATANLFSAEIENVSASDWDMDADSIWGGDAPLGDVDDGGGIGLDFTL